MVEWGKSKQLCRHGGIGCTGEGVTVSKTALNQIGKIFLTDKMHTIEFLWIEMLCFNRKEVHLRIYC